MACIYLLLCSDNSLYCGWTLNLEKRIIAHNSKKGSKYTRARLPVKLVYSEECSGKKDATKRECAIKKMTRVQKLLLINDSDSLSK